MLLQTQEIEGRVEVLSENIEGDSHLPWRPLAGPPPSSPQHSHRALHTPPPPAHITHSTAHTSTTCTHMTLAKLATTVSSLQ